MAEHKPSAAEKAAESAAERAAAAVEAADAADLKVAREEAEEAGTKPCPVCRSPLIHHSSTDPHKAGAWHCNACGRCWEPGLRRVREGYPEPPA